MKVGPFILCLAPLFAQQPTPSSQPVVSPVRIPLSVAIDKALNYAPAMRVAREEKEIVDARLFQAKSAYILPETNVRVLGGLVPSIPDNVGPANNFPETDLFATEWGPYVRARIEAIQPLFTFGKLSGLKDAAKKGVEIRDSGIQSQQNEVKYQVKQIYFTIQYLNSLEEFLDDLFSKARDTKAKVEEKLRSGSSEVTDIDLIRISVFLNETERRTIELKNGIALAYQSLRVITGIPQAQPIELDQKTLFLERVVLKDVDQVFALAQTNRPEIEQVEKLVQVQEGLLKSAESVYYPQFFLGGFFEYNKAPGRPSLNNPYLVNDFAGPNGGAALGLQQSLSFHLNYGKVSQAKAELRKAMAQRDLAKLGMELEIRKAYMDTSSKLAAIESSERAFKAGRSWVLASILNFQAGVAPVKDLLEAFIGYSSVRASYLQTLNEYNLALSKLEQVVGVEFRGSAKTTS